MKKSTFRSLFFRKISSFSTSLLILASFGLVPSHVFAFCLQTFNGYGPVYAPQVQSRTENFTREIVAQGCEVVHLQEIWNSDQISIVQTLARKKYGVWSPNVQTKFGLMTLSQYLEPQSLRQERVFESNNDGGLLDGGREIFGVMKGWATTRLKIPGVEGELDFINLHLHPASEAVRFAQLLEIVLDRSTQTDRRPIVISGDFNMEPLSTEYFFITTALKLRDPVIEKFQQYPLSYCTYCRSNRLSWLPSDHVFDYIFYSHSAPLKVEDFRLDLTGPGGEPYSDHYGLRIGFAPAQARDIRHLESERYFLLSTLRRMQDSLEEKYGRTSKITKNLKELSHQLELRSGSYWTYFSHRGP
jgi:hypothetical protein